MNIPSPQSVHAAAERITHNLIHTPTLTNKSLDLAYGTTLFFKCENLQKAGSFKSRGATNAVLQLQNAACVTTHSSGNHGAAVAMAAQQIGIPAIIVMPSDAPLIKQKNVAQYGAEIVLCKPTYAARESTTERIVQERGAAFIHSNSDPDVISGQGTAALELLADIPDLDIIMTAIGGGGLLSGTGLAASKHVQVIGVEPEQADDAYRSLQAGRIMPNTADTVADGLRVPIGRLPFQIIQKHITEIITVSEAEIIAAMRLLWDQLKIIVEPSGAVPFAAVLNRPKKFANKRVGIILGGGNVDLDKLYW